MGRREDLKDEIRAKGDSDLERYLFGNLKGLEDHLEQGKAAHKNAGWRDLPEWLRFAAAGRLRLQEGLHEFMRRMHRKNALAPPPLRGPEGAKAKAPRPGEQLLAPPPPAADISREFGTAPSPAASEPPAMTQEELRERVQVLEHELAEERAAPKMRKVK